MKRWGLLGALLASIAFAVVTSGPTPSPVPAASISALTYTTAAMQLYVDPTGSDSNATCAATGTSACLTIAGARGKIPKNLRHRAIITIAAGNYAGDAIAGFTIDEGTQKTTAGLMFDGALANVTPTSGSATGTATSGTAGSGVTWGTLTKTAAGWTVNDTAMIGKFLVKTGGTGSGEVGVIVSNTATVLTIAGAWTAPDATTTYAIESPSVHITSCTAAVPNAVGTSVSSSAGFQVFDNANGPVPIIFRNIDVSATCSKSFNVQQSGDVQLLQVTTSGATLEGVRLTSNPGITTITTSYISSAGGFYGVRVNGGANFAALNTFIAPIGSAAFAIGMVNGANAAPSGAALTGVQVNGVYGVFVSRGTVSPVINTLRCNCESRATSVCLYADTGGVIDATSVDVTNCTTGMLANAGLITSTQGGPRLSGNALTYGVNATRSGLVWMRPDFATLTASTAEISVDTGVDTRTFASLLSSYSCLANLTTGSRVCYQ